MGLKEKLKATGNVLVFSLSGFIVGANMYTVIDFQNHMNDIEKNSSYFSEITERKMYADKYLHKNKKFPNNMLTFLSRQEAKNFIRVVNSLCD